MKNKTFQNVLVTFATLATIFFNFYATTAPLNGITTKELSDSYHVYFVPAAYVFAIWGVIYVGMIAIAVYYWLKNKANGGALAELLEKLIPLYLIAALTNCFWLVTWHYKILGLSVVLIVIFLVSLIAMFLQIMRFRKANPAYQTDKQFYWLLQIPVSIYLGWLSVATIANITALLYSMRITEFILSGQAWAGLLCLIAGLLAVLMILKYRNFAFGVVIIWATTGIAQKFPNSTLIVGSVILTVVAIVVATLIRIRKK